MTKDDRYWIKFKNNKFVVQKIIEGKQKQVAKFPTRSLAEKYVDKHKVASAMGKVVDKTYSFHELYQKFATEKLTGGRNTKTCITASAGNRYMAQFKLYIKPNFFDCYIHEIGGRKLQEFIDRLLDHGNKPELFKTAKLVLANMRRFYNWCAANQYHENFHSALQYRIPQQYEPRDTLLRDPVKATVINTKDAARLLSYVWEHRNSDYKTAYACMIFHILFYFGFRRNEILGLKKTNINLIEGYVDISGVWDKENSTYRTETKNKGSKRKVYFDPTGDVAKKLSWMLDYSNKTFPRNDYLIAATRGSNPLSEYAFRKMVYAAYEQIGLARLEWRRDEQSHKFKVIWSPLKGCISKTWRHLKAAQLIQDKQRLELSNNYIKKIMGHDLYSTTRDIYGDHDLLDNKSHHEIAAKIEQHRNKSLN